MKVLVETSARHVHVTQETLEVLFGKGYELTVRKMLSQPGQFVSGERINLVGKKVDRATGTEVETLIKGISILGPVRKANQVELSFTDARTLGVNAPVRESGYVEGTPGCKLVGPAGEVEIKEGIIIAKRHIHMTSADAREAGVENGEIVSVKIETPNGRNLTFGDTVVRVNDNFALAMHIDTDESNAACASGVVYGEIVK